MRSFIKAVMNLFPYLTFSEQLRIILSIIQRLSGVFKHVLKHINKFTLNNQWKMNTHWKNKQH